MRLIISVCNNIDHRNSKRYSILYGIVRTRINKRGKHPSSSLTKKKSQETKIEYCEDKIMMKFRSILPHEPCCCGLPVNVINDDNNNTTTSTTPTTNNNERGESRRRQQHDPLLGYIQLQGSFTPKQQQSCSGKNQQQEGKVDHGGDDGDPTTSTRILSSDGDCGATGTAITTNTSPNTSPPSPHFWSNKESLRQILLSLFSEKNNNNNDTTSCTPDKISILLNNIPYPVIDVEVLGGGSNNEGTADGAQQTSSQSSSYQFTKVRLVYESLQHAYHVMAYLKQTKLCPSQLLSGSFDNNDDSSSNNNLAFSSRPFQITPLVSTASGIGSDLYSENNNTNNIPYWPRSNPPKFRRLVPKPGEDMSVLEQERDNTRFVYISNLFDNDNDTSTSIIPDMYYFAEAIRSVIEKHDTSGYGVEVFVNHNNNKSNKKSRQRAYCHVGMRSSTDAQALIRNLQEKVVTWEWCTFDSTNGTVKSQSTNSGKLFLDYAAITHRSEALATKMINGRSDNNNVPAGEPTRSTCTSETDHVHIPGLVIVPDYLSPEVEEVLMATLTGPHAPWAPTQHCPTSGRLIKRYVQHYGYVFDYKTANVLREKTQSQDADCPPMPQATTTPCSSNGEDDETRTMPIPDLDAWIDNNVSDGDGWNVLAGVVEKTRRFNFVRQTPHDDDELNRDSKSATKLKSFPELNQLTVNQYNPGEGIGSHVDTPSAFGDGLISISLNSGLTMEFRKVGANKNDVDCKKLVYLPRRSCLLMSGDARYKWEHMIVTRTTDTHNGQVIPRQLRLSLTLRTAIDLNGKPMPLLESYHFPPVWGNGSTCSTNHDGNDKKTTTTTISASTSATALVTPSCERDHVHAVYDAIATQWHHTRGRRGVLWPGATQFLQRLPPGSVVADVGCGDGKYFPAIWEAGSYVIGTDISLPLLKTALNAKEQLPDDEVPENRRVSAHRHHLRDRPAVAVADCMSIPLRDNSCDAAICIAVLHHISTPSRRRRCIEELSRIVKPGGTINVQAWAMEQEEGSRHKFAVNDVFVNFNAQPKYLDLGGQAATAVNGQDVKSTELNEHLSATDEPSSNDSGSKSTAQVYSEAFNADYDNQKGLVVFKRYCHLYKQGELEGLCVDIPNIKLVESGFESGNYFIILEVLTS